ncbi:MAG: CpaF family protein [Vampirovibrio sp.]|nr:CpaF family protein [Vampirovibrio sp.]
MSLRERLQKPMQRAGAPINAAGKAPSGESVDGVYQPAQTEHSKGEQFDELKTKIHSKLVENLNFSNADQIEHDEILAAAHKFLEDYLVLEKIPMSRHERELLIQELMEEILGYGPLEPLLKDSSVTEVMVCGPEKVYVEQAGRLSKTKIKFKDNQHLMHIIERIVSAVGRRVDEKTPMVDARLKDGSRVNAIIPPLAIDGAALTIRKFRQDAGSLAKLLEWGSLTEPMAKTLEAAVKCHLNVVISGGTGSGKTTMLNSLSSLIEASERIVTIEDSAELQLRQDHVIRLETRPANIEGEGAIPQRMLLVNSLRMRPDRIIVGECRGGEALDMLQAMNTGHDGSLTTLHANTPRDAVARIQTMCMMNDNPLPEKTIRQQIASAVHLIVQVSRLQDGQRKTTYITEIVGMEGDIITMQDIFKYVQYGVDENFKVIGEHEATGVRPSFAELAAAKGAPLDNDIFSRGSTLPGAEEELPSALPLPQESGASKPSDPAKGQPLQDALKSRLMKDSGPNKQGTP